MYSTITRQARSVRALEQQAPDMENIAHGHDSFAKTLNQWISSSGHRQNLLMRDASRVGVASAKSSRTGRTYWAMVIAGSYDQTQRAAPKATPKARSPAGG